MYYRIAYHNNNIYIDLADKGWKVIEITGDGWRILSKSPVNFIRYQNSRPLPEPKNGGKIENLKKFINIEDEDFYVVIDFLLNVLSPIESYIGMLLIGEQGSAKSTSAKLIKYIIDPDIKQKLSAPKNEEDLIVAASRSKVIVYDNLSKCSQSFSDSLCRLLDGSSLSKRKLFTNYDEVILTVASPIILTAINNVFTYQDLLDRVVMLSLKSISAIKRKEEKILFQEFEKEHPYILGSLCDMVSQGLRNINNVKLNKKPRKADFAKWLVACECENQEKKLLKSYLNNIEKVVNISISENPLTSTLINWFDDKNEWSGMLTELVNILFSYSNKENRARLPKATNKFSQELIRISSFLRKKCIDIKREHTREGSYITIRKLID